MKIETKNWLNRRNRYSFYEGESVYEKNVETISEGEMPPAVYLITHPEARLSAAEKQALIEGLRATINR